MVCMEDGRQGFSLWSMVLITISHVLLVLNSSINILIYCLLSSKFREECRGLVKKLRWAELSALSFYSYLHFGFQIPITNEFGWSASNKPNYPGSTLLGFKMRPKLRE